MANVSNAVSVRPQVAVDSHRDNPSFLQHQFDSPAQQFDAAKLGMWLWVAAEIVMFAGLFVAYAVSRGTDGDIFHQAHLQLGRGIGTVNTVVLLFSSLTAALAVSASQQGKRNLTSVYLAITLGCAAVFLAVKYFEYSQKVQLGLLPGRCFGHPGFEGCIGDAGLSTQPVAVLGLPVRANMFFALYFMMTGLHGLHVLVGMAILFWVLMKNIRGGISAQYFTPVDIGALYWHLVGIIWIYLFPLLYLVG